MKKIRSEFNRTVNKVLDQNAIISIRINNEGNPEFQDIILSQSEDSKATSQAKGTSYKKLLCEVFDISILSTYAEKEFYRFVYHDGVFEAYDDRIKLNLLDIIRNLCEKKGIQYILSIIDSDLPRDENDKKVDFAPHEIILSLHDGGNNGRLFRMDPF